MSDLPDLLADDLQASLPEVRLGLSRAGVRGVEKAIRIRDRQGAAEELISARIDCGVALEAAQKRVHKSLFPELFEQAIVEAVTGAALLVPQLAEHIDREI